MTKSIMRRASHWKPLGIGLLTCSALLAVERRAQAAEPAATLEHTQLLGGVRFGSEGLKLGLGARGGYTLHNSVYLGGQFDYFLGDSDEVSLGGARITSSAHLWMISAEGGYDFGLTPSLVVRPFGGLGVAHAGAEVCTEIPGDRMCANASEDDIVFSMGGLLYYVSGALMLGPELRLLIVDDAAVVIGANIGGMF
jgi:hypothetical protein